MSDETRGVISDAAEKYFESLERDGYRLEGCSSLEAADAILAALAETGHQVCKSHRIYGVGYRSEDGEIVSQFGHDGPMSDRAVTDREVARFNFELRTDRYLTIYKDVWFGGSGWQVAE